MKPIVYCLLHGDVKLVPLQGCAQVSLADFCPKQVSCVWYNVLSFKFMQEGGLQNTATPGSYQGNSIPMVASQPTATSTQQQPMVGTRLLGPSYLGHYIFSGRGSGWNCYIHWRPLTMTF